MVCYDTVNTWLLFRNLENALHCICCCLVFTQFKNKQRCKKNGQCLTLNSPQQLRKQSSDQNTSALEMCPKLFDETLVGHWLIPLGLIDMFPSIVLSCCILKNSCLIISFILKNGTSKDCLTNQNTIAEVKESMYGTSHKRV